MKKYKFDSFDVKNLKVVRKTLHKNVDVLVDKNERYFTIYQVRALNSHGQKVLLECYLELKHAERRVKFINANCRHIYGLSYVFELKVLCSAYESVKRYDD